MEFNKVITTRHSVRTYDQKKVEEEKIEYVLESARLAPSWANKQCWRFIVISDENTIKEIAKASIVNRWLKNVPSIIVACGDPTESGSKNDIDYYSVDVAIAMEHIVLAATDIGLGTCWIAAFNEEKIKNALKIPPRIKVVALTPIGYPASKQGLLEKTMQTVVKPKKRRNLSEIVHYDKW